jgi:hypothetical protein
MTHYAWLRRAARSASSVALMGGLLTVAFAPIHAQTIPSDPGLLPRPKPYFGTRNLGNRPVPYPAPGTPAPDPLSYWKKRIIYTGNGCGSTVIIIHNGVPCYVPYYYVPMSYVRNDYSGLRISYNGRFGGYNLQTQQTSGYGAQGYVVPDTHRENPPVPVYIPVNGEDRRSGHQDVEGVNDYYLHRQNTANALLERDPSLAQAVANIETAFRAGDISLLEWHVSPNEMLSLYSSGRVRSRISGADYLQMTREALPTMRTVRYSLNRVEATAGGRRVSGVHVLRGEDGSERAFQVAFTLRKRGGAWVITEVRAEPAR